MNHSDEGEHSAEETQSGPAPAEEPQSSQTTSDASEASETRDEDDQQDPEVAEIEQDPSRNPDNKLLRDIKGG